MNKLQKIIDNECASLTFDCDIAEFEQKYQKRRRAIRCAAIPIASVCILIIAALSVFIFGNSQRTSGGDGQASESVKQNSFFITAYAAETSDPDSTADTARKKYDIPDKSSVVIPEFRFIVHETEQPERTYKRLEKQGNTEIGVNGDNIKTVKFHSEISQFCYDIDAGNCFWENDLIIKYDAVFPESNSVYWGFPEEYNYWFEKQEEPGYVFEFSDLPRDTVTITVTFIDGSVEQKLLDLYFNDNGCLVAEIKES